MKVGNITIWQQKNHLWLKPAFKISRTKVGQAQRQHKEWVYRFKYTKLKSQFTKTHICRVLHKRTILILAALYWCSRAFASLSLSRFGCAPHSSLEIGAISRTIGKWENCAFAVYGWYNCVITLCAGERESFFALNRTITEKFQSRMECKTHTYVEITHTNQAERGKKPFQLGSGLLLLVVWLGGVGIGF